VRILLLPSIVVLLGRWNWWPSPQDPDAGANGRRPSPVPEAGYGAAFPVHSRVSLAIAAQAP
jgi:hypothetical protein